MTILVSKDYVYKNISGFYNIVQCKKCKLVYTNPRLKNDILKEHYYKTNDFGSAVGKLQLEKKKDIIFQRKILVNYFNYPFGKKSILYKITHYPLYSHSIKKRRETLIIPKFINNGKILEIGCSYGIYLYQLKRMGWEVKGIELNKKAANYGSHMLNLEILNLDILEFNTNEKFDIIYMRMVLEHLKSPMLVLEKINALLKPNGRLVLILPDFSGFEVRLYKKYAYTLQVPYHLYHFTPKTINNYLKMFNFRKVKIYHDNFDRDLIAPLSFKVQENPQNRILKLLLKFSTNIIIRRIFVRIIINIFAWLGKSSRMTVVAQKGS